MRHILLAIIDRMLVAVLVAVLVLAALLYLEPWEPDITDAVAVHAAEPLDVNDRIVVRWEFPDGTEALPPREMFVWEYVWKPLEEGRADEQAFRSAFERDLHAGDTTWHLTHEVIDAKEW
ncbi:MAG: hypothetical protein M0R37_13555 [Bacteroidales bacterium]|nr:hypothetical protein [Bacteroidales bacterium]